MINKREFAEKNRNEINSCTKEWLKYPSDFGYHGNLDLFNTWTLGPVIEHRDSDTIARSNAYTIVKWLEEKPEFNGQWEITHCGHWLVGWVDHLSFKMYTEVLHTKVITPIALWLQENYFDALEQYPILDKLHYSGLESEKHYGAFLQSLSYALAHYDLDDHDNESDIAKIYDIATELSGGCLQDNEGWFDYEEFESIFGQLGWIE